MTGNKNTKQGYGKLLEHIRTHLIIKEKDIKPNPGLLYFKLFPCSHREPEKEDNKKIKVQFLENLCTLSLDEQAFQKRIQTLTTFCNNNLIELENTTPILIGTGYTNTEECGFFFDRTLGFPYLPGSSLKGTLLSFLEAHAANPSPVEKWDDNNYALIPPGDKWIKEDIVKVFGFQSSKKDDAGDKGNREYSTGTKKTGGAIFPGAYPVHFSGFETDIITPHYTDYYTNSKNPPLDIYSPVPIYFLTIKPGSRFRFLLKTREAQNGLPGDILERLKNLIRETGRTYGFGAKTASGYGYFSDIQGVK